MRTSYAMMALKATQTTEDEGVVVDGVVEAGGVVVSIRGCLDLSCASLYRTVAVSMAFITVK